MRTALFFICIVLSLFASSQVAQPARELVLATYTYSTNDRLSGLKPLAEYLGKQTGLKFRAVSYPTVQALMEGLRKKEADLAMINTLGYLSFQKKFPGIIRPVVTLDMGGKGPTNYGGCLLAARNSGIGSIEDLSGRNDVVLALVNNSSTSGNLVPRLLLNSKGIPQPETKFRVYYAGTHRQVTDDLLSNKAIIGGCGCDEYEKSASLRENLVIVSSYNNIPLGPIVHQETMPAGIVRMIRNALLKVHHRSPKVFQDFCAGWTEFIRAKKFKPVTDQNYNEFRAMFGSNERLWNLLEQ